MSWLDDVIKKISENTGISKAGEQIEKYATKMMIAQDNLAHAATNTVTKARPEIERGLGQEVLNMATQSPQQMQMPGVANLMAQGKAMDQNVLAQQIAANSQGEFFGMPSIMPERSTLEQTVQSQKNILGKVGDTMRSEGRMGTDKAGKGFGNDLYKFIQSIGYGMIDKPLGREANTWDYLGKTVGQIARLNEGSGLGAGQQIYNNDTTVQSTTFKRDLLDPSVEEAISSNNPETKIKKYRELLTKYPFARAVLADLFGYSRNYSVDADEQINNILRNMKK